MIFCRSIGLNVLEEGSVWSRSVVGFSSWDFRVNDSTFSQLSFFDSRFLQTLAVRWETVRRLCGTFSHFCDILHLCCVVPLKGVWGRVWLDCGHVLTCVGLFFCPLSFWASNSPQKTNKHLDAFIERLLWLQWHTDFLLLYIPSIAIHAILFLLMFSNLNQIFPLKNPISFLKPFFDGSANDESVQRFLLLFSVSERSSIMPSELENAMESLIKVFHRYAKDNQLSRRELRELMENELSNFLKVQKPARRGLNLWVGLWADPPLPLAGSEGPRRRRQDHEGPGRQRGRPSGLWGVCVFGCWTVGRLWAMLPDGDEEAREEVKNNGKKPKSISIFVVKIVLSIKETGLSAVVCVCVSVLLVKAAAENRRLRLFKEDRAGKPCPLPSIKSCLSFPWGICWLTQLMLKLSALWSVQEHWDWATRWNVLLCRSPLQECGGPESHGDQPFHFLTTSGFICWIWWNPSKRRRNNQLSFFHSNSRHRGFFLKRKTVCGAAGHRMPEKLNPGVNVCTLAELCAHIYGRGPDLVDHCSWLQGKHCGC